MRITDIRSYTVRLPVSPEERVAGVIGEVAITEVTTDEGVTGRGFGGLDPIFVERLIKPTLVGEDPFDVERLLGQGLLFWPPVEVALWDVMGRATGRPAHQLLGGGRPRQPIYLTCVWPGRMGQRGVTPERQAEMAVAYHRHGYRAIKLQMWRDDPEADLEVVRLIREAVGGREALEIMVDRTGPFSGQLWTFETALRAARRLEALDATWLEEPLSRGDTRQSAELAAAVDLPITGGEADRGLWPFKDYLVHRSYDIIQPDVLGCGGIWTARKIGALAEAFGAPCILHGSHGFNLYPWLHAAAAIPSCRLLEVVYVVPPITPPEQWAPLARLLTSGEFLHLEEGALTVPTGPGLGVAWDEDALRELRAPDPK
jgi:L-alanine-DL-glutamate epimerase-like enolase superfamily enzyme